MQQKDVLEGKKRWDELYTCKNGHVFSSEALIYLRYHEQKQSG
jgi:hypothetical protein